MLSYASLPSLNAGLNLTSAVLLTCGYALIRQNRVFGHRVCMSTAFIVSVLFLVFYLIYHFHVGTVRYHGQGLLRVTYFAILISHTMLAVLIVPMILRTLYLAIRRRFDDHRQLARWTLPLWFYVSVTGVVIYKMLY